MILFLAQKQKKRHQHRRGMSSETSVSLNSAYYTPPKKESQPSIYKKNICFSGADFLKCAVDSSGLYIVIYW